MAVIIDTSVAILMRDGDADALVRVATMEDVGFSVVTLVELEGGVAAVPALAAVREMRLRQLLTQVTTLPFDEECALAYGRIVRQLGYSRKQVLDRMIAATALVRGAAIVTANTSDFRGIKGLQLRKW